MMELDRFEGAMLGCAVGDALGAPLEGLSKEEILHRHETRVRDFLFEGYGPGAFTDDTQMAISLAESLVACGRFDMDSVACAFGEWMRLHDDGEREARSYDRASAIACRRLYRGVPRMYSAVESESAVAAVRSVPVGLFTRDAETIVSAAILQAALTHNDPRPLAGATAVSLAVAHGISAPWFDAGTFLRSISLFVEDAEPGMAAKISGLEAYLHEPLNVGLGYTGTSSLAIEAVPAALFIFAKIPHHTEEAVVTAINAGGATDSIGAMVGAFSGALNGAKSIPKRWLLSLEDRGRLESLARNLHKISSAAGDSLAG